MPSIEPLYAIDIIAVIVTGYFLSDTQFLYRIEITDVMLVKVFIMDT